VLSLFQELLPVAFVEQAHKQAGVRHHNCVYNPLVAMWLLVVQRLHGGAPLETAVMELLRGLPASFWPRPCKRMRDWQEKGKPLSSHAGAYHQARQALSLSVVQQSCDRIFEELAARTAGTGPESETRAFVLDGSSMRLAHSPAITQYFPPGHNQHGENHWPVMRVLVAHDLRTGLAMRPEWGPMNGPEAVSEQYLLEKAIGRLPAGSTVIGDANFGVFSVAYAGQQSGHPVLLRLTSVRAQRLAGENLQGGMDRPVVWKPSRDDRRSHPSLPADACVKGRLIVCQVQPNNGAVPFLLALFVTLPCAGSEILNLYGQRWNIETDLRTLKTHLCLEQLTCSTPDMAAKDIQMSIAAYNLVRALICLASQQSGIAPRGYSFTKVQRIVQVFTPKLAAAADPQQAQQIFDQMMYYVQQARLPKRRHRRPSYPRAIWNKGTKYPRRQK
jgi:putative transposase